VTGEQCQQLIPENSLQLFQRVERNSLLASISKILRPPNAYNHFRTGRANFNCNRTEIPGEADEHGLARTASESKRDKSAAIKEGGKSANGGPSRQGPELLPLTAQAARGRGDYPDALQSAAALYQPRGPTGCSPWSAQLFTRVSGGLSSSPSPACCVAALICGQQLVGSHALDALCSTVKRDFHDPETLRAALETLLVVFMYEDHPVAAHLHVCTISNPSPVAFGTDGPAKITRQLCQGIPCGPGPTSLTNYIESKQHTDALGMSPKPRLLFSPLRAAVTLKSPQSPTLSNPEMPSDFTTRNITTRLTPQ